MYFLSETLLLQKACLFNMCLKDVGILVDTDWFYIALLVDELIVVYRVASYIPLFSLPSHIPNPSSFPEFPESPPNGGY